jgi:prepilin-type N-terminal cleavage/methylation domain-containing protein
MTKPSHHSPPLPNCDGFTLIEIIVVLVIMSVLASVVAQRLIALDASAINKTFACAVSELNGRECLTWARVKTSPSNWISDVQVFGGYDPNLGPDFQWSSKAPDGGVISFKGHEFKLERSPSTSSTPGSWKEK